MGIAQLFLVKRHVPRYVTFYHVALRYATYVIYIGLHPQVH